jgi:signal peptidase I
MTLARIRRVASTTLMVAAFGLGTVMLVPAALGLERYVVTGDSMTGTYDRGSIVFGDPVPVSQLRVGDVITYVPPHGSGPGGRVTHRIVSVAPGPDGRPLFHTQGDANATPDPWQFQLQGEQQPRVVFSIPFVGYLLSALAIRAVRMLVIGLPAILIALVIVVRLWREAGDDLSLHAGPEAASGGVPR